MPNAADSPAAAPAADRSAALYWFGLITCAAALLALIFWAGADTGQLPHPPVQPVSDKGHGPTPHILLALGTISVMAAGFGWLVQQVGQPPVMGEILAGIALGPSLLGALAPEVREFILPSTSTPFLGIVAQIGVVVFMFLTGLELDVPQMRAQSRRTFLIAQSSMVVPMVLGCATALLLYRPFGPPGVAFLPFALFIGASLSVTAFPVLARILRDRGLLRTPVGAVALGAASIDDVTAWIFLAFLSSLGRGDGTGAFWTLGALAVFCVVLFGVVRPLLARAAARAERSGKLMPNHVPRWLATLLLGGLLAAASATKRIGVHPLFGAFAFGAIVPRRAGLPQTVTHRLEMLVQVTLLPAFFALAGTRTELGLLNTWQDWLWCLLITLVATVGKFAGATLAGRYDGMLWKDAVVVGVLMNTRGLMELIVLNIGLDLGILTPKLYTMFVIMALATTLATGPLLQRLLPATSPDPRPA